MYERRMLGLIGPGTTTGCRHAVEPNADSLRIWTRVGLSKVLTKCANTFCKCSMPLPSQASELHFPVASFKLVGCMGAAQPR